ncbi:MAG: hypothetical protein ACJ769_06030 [Chloroflexota bacterium]
MMTTEPKRAKRPHIGTRTVTRAGRHSPMRVCIVAGIGLSLAAVLGGCASGALSSGSLAVPSVDVSAAASAGAQLGLRALDQVDAAIAANETSGKLSAENATTLKNLSASIRTSLQSGDVSAAKTASTDFAAKVDEFASGLTGDAGTKLQDAVAALKAAVGS